jgi:hypothetical protein
VLLRHGARASGGDRSTGTLFSRATATMRSATWDDPSATTIGARIDRSR